LLNARTSCGPLRVFRKGAEERRKPVAQTNKTEIIGLAKCTTHAENTIE